MSQTIHTIVLPTRPQPDTIVAVFLLHTFGEQMYPGIKTAKVTVDPKALPTEGHLLIDVAGGELDHHGTDKCATELVAAKLNLLDKAELRNMIAYARRDDTKGQGTISKDTLDRAFGLSGLIAALNKQHTTDTDLIVQTILPLLSAHYKNAYEHYVAIPKLITTLTESKDFSSHTLQTPIRNMPVVFVSSDHIGLAGYLRSNAGGTCRVVVQRRPSGHVNILTKQDPKINLSRLMAVIRLRELQMNDFSGVIDEETLTQTTTHKDVPEWYYDTATNSLLNGGVTPDSVPATRIPWDEMQQIVLHFLTECSVDKPVRRTK
jgi:hypothetical protein